MTKNISCNRSNQVMSFVFVGRCYVCGEYENDVFVEVDKCKTDNETGTQELCPSGFCAVSFQHYQYHQYALFSKLDLALIIQCHICPANGSCSK